MIIYRVNGFAYKVSGILQKNNLLGKYYKYSARSPDTVFFMAMPAIRRGQVIQAWTRKQFKRQFHYLLTERTFLGCKKELKSDDREHEFPVVTWKVAERNVLQKGKLQKGEHKLP